MSGATDPEKVRAELAETRAQMGATIEELHGRLNPIVLKQQALESFQEVKETVAKELKQQFTEAKEAMRAELTEARQAVKAEYAEVKATLKSEVAAEVGHVKDKIAEEVGAAKTAMRAATIGKVEHMVHEAQDKVIETSTTVIDTIKANPIPVALIGAGIAWMFFGDRGKRSTARPQRAASTPLLSEGQQIANVAHQAADSIGRAAHSATDTVSQVAHRTAERSAEIARKSKEGMKKAQQRTTQMYRTNPMAIGAAVLAVGTAVGLAIPSTKREDAFMGEARDGLFGKAEEAAHDVLEKVGGVAKQLAESGMKPVDDVWQEDTKTEATVAGSPAKPSQDNRQAPNRSKSPGQQGAGTPSTSASEPKKPPYGPSLA